MPCLHVKWNYFEIISAFVDVRLKEFFISARGNLPKIILKLGLFQKLIAAHSIERVNVLEHLPRALFYRRFDTRIRSASILQEIPVNMPASDCIFYCLFPSRSHGSACWAERESDGVTRRRDVAEHQRRPNECRMQCCSGPGMEQDVRQFF